MKKTFFLGSFPPPYGGVTVKNKLLYDFLKDKIDIRPKQKCTYTFVLTALLFGNKFVLSPGHTENLLFLTSLFSFLRPKAMKKSIVFVVGGNLADLVQNDKKMLKKLSKYKCLYIEPKRMYKRLKKAGLTNVAFFPNCRMRPKSNYEATRNDKSPLRCVFFSRIMPEKGVNNILDALMILHNIQMDFYGSIEKDYEEVFVSKVNSIPNAEYKGLFTGRNDSLYQILHEYDVMILPTYFKTEGIPGALVEAKIAALPAIVSNVSYNSEIVEDGISGIVLKENTVKALAGAIEKLDKNRDFLYELKCGAQQSAGIYYIENYINNISANFT